MWKKIVFIFIIGVSGSSFGWEKICTLPATDLGPKVTFSKVELYRQRRDNGRYDYQMVVPVGVGDRCGLGQYPTAKVFVSFFMTKNVIFQSGEFKFYKGNHVLKKTFEDKLYLECIDSDWNWNYDCSF